MKFKVGQKVEFKNFEKIKVLHKHGIIISRNTRLSYVEEFIKKSKTLTIIEIKDNTLFLKEAYLWEGPYIVTYRYPPEWFKPNLKDKINKLLEI